MFIPYSCVAYLWTGNGEQPPRDHDLERDETTAIVEERFFAGVIAIRTNRLGGVKEETGGNEQGQLCGDEA